MLRLHRWVALLFALPILVVTVTGLILAAEPALKARTPPGTVTLERLEAVLDAAGPAPGAGLFIRGWEGTAVLGGRGMPPRSFDLATAQPREAGWLPGLFLSSRRMHETLLLDLGWLVTASTAACVLLAPLGLLLGWPKLRNSLGGWHRLVGWVGLPLLVGSPLTGLALALGITFAPSPPPAAGGPPLPLRDAVRLVAERHPLDGLDFIRTVGGGQRLVRVLDGSGTAIIYRVTPGGLQPVATNWPRLLHEGNWAGVMGSVVNAVAGLGLVMLLVTGLWIWARRRLLRRRATAARAPRAAPIR